METQNIEYKESWRDEYLKWICGFANANGGTIFIGITDKGDVSGLKDAKKLLEDIPNKTKDILGIIVDVNLKTKNKLNYLEIITEAYPYPVTYKGQYHYRTGSTKQELKGAALDKFILQKQGKHWDAVPQPDLSVKELDKSAIDYFRKNASESNRVSKEDLKVNTTLLLEKLHLKADNTYLKRAVGLVFYHDPEKYITGSYIKIGFFRTDDDLVYQDEIHGNLFDQVNKCMDLLLTKYLKANISYKGLNRIEKFPIPEAALREALLNAVIHKDYSSGNPIQISVYDDKLMIWNQGQLPDNWTVENLKQKHSSHPYNPDIANCFFRAGLIEAWGRGTLKIMNECKNANVSLPKFKYDMSGFWVEFEINKDVSTIPLIQFPENTSIENKILALMKENDKIKILELVENLNISSRTISKFIDKLKIDNKLIRIGSKKVGYWKVIEN